MNDNTNLVFPTYPNTGDQPVLPSFPDSETEKFGKEFNGRGMWGFLPVFLTILIWLALQIGAGLAIISLIIVLEGSESLLNIASNPNLLIEKYPLAIVGVGLLVQWATWVGGAWWVSKYRTPRVSAEAKRLKGLGVVTDSTSGTVPLRVSPARLKALRKTVKLEKINGTSGGVEALALIVPEIRNTPLYSHYASLGVFLIGEALDTVVGVFALSAAKTGKNFRANFWLDNIKWAKDIMLGVALAVSLVVFQIFIMNPLLGLMFDSDELGNTDAVLNHSLPIAILLGLVGAGIIGPIVEEVFFRGFLTRTFLNILERRAERSNSMLSSLWEWLDKHSAIIALTLASIIFGLAHIQGTVIGSVVVVGYTTIVGFVLGAVVLRTGRLMPAIIGHVVHNFLLSSISLLGII